MSNTDVCPTCGRPYGVRRRCYYCHGRRRATAPCIDCGSSFERPIDKDSQTARCPECFKKFNAARSARWRAEHPERAKAIYDRSNAKRLADPEHRRKKREAEARRLYGIEPDELQRMLAAQKHRCAICKQQANGKGPGGARLHLDHNHETGQIRGLLCGNCNTGLGLLGDDPKRLRAALKYLRKAG